MDRSKSIVLRPGWRRLTLLRRLAVLVLGLLLAAPAKSPGTTPFSQSFVYTGGEQMVVVPQGITAIHVSVVGGEGGGGGAIRPGMGGAVSGDIQVTPGEHLFVEVGGNGADGGWNGGGTGGCVLLFDCSGDGGGASDIRTTSDAQPGSLDSRLVVAGGGGGAGDDSHGLLCLGHCWGGGNAGSPGRYPPFDGGAGTTSGGGAGGWEILDRWPFLFDTCSGPDWIETYGANGSVGILGSGGAGAVQAASLVPNAAGGGGGYYGGGGGAACAASEPDHAGNDYEGNGNGGGGSSYAGPEVTNASIAVDWTGKPSVTITAPVPTAVSAPKLQGGAAVGSVLTASHGTWTDSPTAYSYEWQRCDSNGAVPSCVPIPGATGHTYTPTSSDVGSTIRVAEIAANFYGAGDLSLSSNATGVIGDLPGNVAPPAVDGSTVEAQTLSAQRGVWSNGATAFSHQWWRCNAVGAGCAPVAGATGLRYGLTVADVGSTLRVQEVASNRVGAGLAAMSAAVGPVIDAPLSVQAFALVGTVGSVIPGPIASLADAGDRIMPPGGYRVLIRWGDGRTGHGRVVVGPAGTYLVNAAHVYARQGSYSVTVRASAPAGASATSTNRVSVFAAAVCPKRASARGRNCVGQVVVRSGCIFRPRKLKVSIKGADSIAGVRYYLDRSRRRFGGIGPSFTAFLPTAGLSSGTHRLTAVFSLRSGKVRAVSRTVAIC